MEKFIFRKDTDVDWTSTVNEPFPFTTASHSFHQDWSKDEKQAETFFDEFAHNFVKTELERKIVD